MTIEDKGWGCWSKGKTIQGVGDTGTNIRRKKRIETKECGKGNGNMTSLFIREDKKHAQ